MQRRRPQAVSLRLAPAAAWLLAATPVIGASPALAEALPADMAGLQAWAADTTSRALQAAEPTNDAAAGAREVLNRSVSLGVLGLQTLGPGWLHRFTFKVEFQEELRPRYDVVATQPLLRSWRRGTLLWLRGHLAHDPGGALVGDLGLHYRPSLPDQEPTLSLSGLVEDHGALGHRRYGVAAALRARDFEATGTLYDDVADAGQRVSDRALDGYDIALAARVPRLPWAWVRARQRWQIALDGTQASVRDDLSLQLRPFTPLEVEAGASDDGQRRDWFAKLRLKLRLGDR